MYQQKYLKYKTKYLQIQNSQQLGGNSAFGFMQIFKQNYVCSTVSKDAPEILVRITGEKQYLKETGIINDNCLKLPSQNKFIEVLGTFDIPIDDIKRIFQHSKDKILDIIIKNHKFSIIGDTGILYTGYVSDNIPDLNQKGIILEGSKSWLRANNLAYF